jgi:hypothetical protein
LNEISMSRLSAGSVFKLILIGTFSVHLAFVLLFLVFMVLSGSPLHAPGGEPTTYLYSYLMVFSYLLFGLIFVPFGAAIAWVHVWPCMWVYSIFFDMKIRYVRSN